MAQQTINIGTIANDGTGDPLRDAFDKCNDNFNELYADTISLNATGIQDGSLIFNDGGDPNKIATSDLNADITVEANGTGRIVLDTDTVRISTDRTPPDLINGATGDTKGDIAFDTDFIYVCIQSFGVGTPVWKKAALV